MPNKIRSMVAIVAVCLCLAGTGTSFARMGGGCGGGGCGGGGSSVIDPPVGALFKDPPEMPVTRASDGALEVNLEAKVAPININGTTANLMTYNGSYPAPTIRVNSGDLVRVYLKNSLPYTEQTNILGFQRNVTNLHTHGWHVSPNDPSDFVMYELMSGETKIHEYDTSLQSAGTLNLYHPHIHGLAAEQYWAGLVGALVTNDDTNVLSEYETHIMVLKDISLSGASPEPHSRMDYMNGKEGSTVMVNGQVNPRLHMKAGEVQRWRILNASNARFYRLSLDSHYMYLVGTDGGLLDKPYRMSEIILSPSERVDILVKATKGTGSYKLKALPYSRTNMGMGTSGQQTVTLMTVTYKGSNPQNLPAVVNPDAQRIVMDTSMLPHKTFTLSMSMGRGYINGQDFDVDPLEVHSRLGDYEVWTIVNQSCMDHPFHQHVNAAQVLSVSGGDAGYASTYTSIPAMKDTVLVPKMGSVTLLVPVMDFDGMTMFHCHILEHEDIGMMGMWMIMDMPEM